MKTVCLAWMLVVSASAQTAISHFYRVDDHVYRGRQPGRAAYPELAKMGIKTVLDLRGGPIHKPHERKLVEAAGMRYVSIRLSGLFPPKDWQVARIVEVMVNPADTPVFVHCRRGDDRVGMAIACYRIVHDHWTNRQALAEAEKYHINILEVLMRRYIRKFDATRVERYMASDAVLADNPSH